MLSSTNFNTHYVLALLTLWLLLSCSATDDNNRHFPDKFAKLTAVIAHTSSGLSRKKQAFTGKYQGIRSVLISQNGKLLYEKYFNDGRSHKAVNVASLGKSLLSTMIGIAIDKGMITSVDESVYQYFSYRDYLNWDDDKARLQINHLLSMTPGWECGDINNYASHCGAKMLRHEDRLKWLLDLPMKATPGTLFNYNDAVPHLLVAILAQATKQNPAEFFEQHIQTPLELDNNLYDKNHLTARDMLKVGQLYLQKSYWNGQQLISQQYIEQSTSSSVRFKNNKFDDGYGYLWWQKTFVVNNTKYNSYYAAGNGGQYIFVVPELKLVAVFTGSNYGNIALTRQPLDIMHKYILPLVSSDISLNQ